MTQYEKLHERVGKLTAKGYAVIFFNEPGRHTEVCIMFRAPFCIHYLYANSRGFVEKDIQIQPPTAVKELK